MKINLNPNQNPSSDADREAKIAAGGFGKHYTDNMLVAEWSEATGWSDAEIKAYGPLSIDPATSVLHYGQEIFEGLKAYSHPCGRSSHLRFLIYQTYYLVTEYSCGSSSVLSVGSTLTLRFNLFFIASICSFFLSILLGWYLI